MRTWETTWLFYKAQVTLRWGMHETGRPGLSQACRLVGIILGRKSFSVCWSLPERRHYPVGLDKCLKLPALSGSSGELIPEDTPVGRKPYGACLAGHLQFCFVTESVPSRMCQDGYSNSINSDFCFLLW